MAVVPDNGGAVARWTQRVTLQREPLAGAFFWLSAFYLVYCARPEDWIPFLVYIPLAKISGICAVLGLLMSAGSKTQAGISRRAERRDVSARHHLRYVRLCIVVYDLERRRVLQDAGLFQGADRVGADVHGSNELREIAANHFHPVRVGGGDFHRIFAERGRSHPRLEGVIGGIYSNPNDLAFAIVLCLPFCFAFLLRTRSLPRKLVWGGVNAGDVYRAVS